MAQAEDAPARRVAVLTGATSGIGLVAAKALAGAGLRLVLVARDRARAELALAQLPGSGEASGHRVLYADLSLVAETRRAGREIAESEPRIDLLVNNAGALYSSRQLTAEGLERTFATNHMAYFVLTDCLLKALKAAAPSRIVNTASRAHRAARLNLEDLQSLNHYAGLRAYANSKLCNLLFTAELARRLAGTGVSARALSPGFVATRFADEAGGLIGLSLRMLKRFARSPEQGARTLLHLALAPALEGEDGGYFHDCAPARPSRAAQDPVLARRLWEASQALAALC
jgi:NAD(P)-dependent dehydrogenase (short-subunit alcohol dehydrogenase family)